MSQESLSRNLLLWIKILLFIDFLAVALVVPILSSYFRDAGVSSAQYSYISSIYSTAQLVGSIFIGGMLNDTLSKRKIFLISFVGSMVSYALVGISTNIQFLFVSRVIVGLVKNSYTTSTLIIAEITKSQPTDNDLKPLSNRDNIDSSMKNLDPIPLKKNTSQRASELSQLSAIMSAGFLIGPSIGGLLYKYDKRLPALLAASLFALNIFLLETFLPKNDYFDRMIVKSTVPSNSERRIELSLSSLSRYVSDNIISIKQSFSNPSTIQLVIVMTVKILLTFTQNAMSYQHILHYYEDRFGIETYQIGFISSIVMGSRMIFNAFFVGISIESIGGDDGYVIVICIILLIITSICEYLASNLMIYLLLALIPAVFIGTIIETAGKTWLLHYTPYAYQGTIFSIINTVMSGVGIFSPVYGAMMFGYFGGAVNKGFVAAVHYLIIGVISVGLYSLMRVKDRHLSRVISKDE